TISAHENYVYGIVYLPGGGRLVTCSDDHTVRIWDLENGEQEGMAMEHGGISGWAQGLAVTRDGRRILSSASYEVLRVWDTETHQPIAEWGGHEGSILCTVPGDVNSICFSPDGTKLASGHDDNMIRVFDVENGDLILGPIQGHTKQVYSVIWSLDGSRLFTASWDRSIRLWDSETGEAIGDPWTGHTNLINSLSLSPDGKKLASASRDGTVRFWDTESGDPIGEPLQHGGEVWVATFSPSGEFVACGEQSGKVSIWRSIDLTSQPLLTISAHEDPVCGIAYLPGGGQLVTCSDDKTVRIWDMENGKQDGMAMEHGDITDWTLGLAVTRDGRRILSSGPDNVLRVWDVETQQSIAEWDGHEGTILCIVVSPDDQLVASGDRQGRIIIRETKEDGQTKHAIETVPGDVNSICFSPDGTKLASGHDDNMIRVFDVESGDLILGPIEGHTHNVNSVIWSLDGSRLFTASWDHSIRLWDSETGEAIGDPWTGHINYVNTMSLSPDGTKLASGSSDDTVRFWGTESGDPI
ncbi:hypothetical protein PAXINDRAFT_43158, partial [Paxillus involutus ATCC 200175]